ncbi:MAG: hypothetical protein V3S46_06255 [Nitrospinota bacterium]
MARRRLKEVKGVPLCITWQTAKGTKGSGSFAYAPVPKKVGRLRIEGFHTNAFDPGKGE